jgi:hypothetical protein
MEDLRAVLIMKAGYYKTIETNKGVTYLPKSISFASMDEVEFEEVYNNVHRVVCEFIGVTSEEVEQELINFM